MITGVAVGPAAIADGRGSFSIETIEVDPPGPGEVRVTIAAAGVCHTDHASLRWPGSLVMGHEGAGHVEAIGEGVTGLEIGQPVLLNWAIPCGACFQCDHGTEALCERTRTTVRGWTRADTRGMFDHVYAEPHALVEAERAWFERYERSFTDTEVTR